jgi:FkbM family methyltransferase
VREFFRQFAARGDLVFDVGANDGRYTAEMLQNGCRIVAIEPNPALARTLRSRYRVAVVEAAVGDGAGVATLHLGTNPVFSTVSAAWMGVARERGLANEWTGDTVVVPVVTLDALIERYGVPRYVKIDVEGYEPAVLGGLSLGVDFLSFEVQVPALEMSGPCFDRLERLGGYHYAVSFSDQLRLEYAWVTRNEIEAALKQSAALHADVFARSTAAFER